MVRVSGANYGGCSLLPFAIIIGSRLSFFATAAACGEELSGRHLDLC
jgi:hypothetical protein